MFLHKMSYKGESLRTAGGQKGSDSQFVAYTFSKLSIQVVIVNKLS